MAANRRRLVYRLQAEDPPDLPALERQVYSWNVIPKSVAIGLGNAKARGNI
jgi:hypothetical protein